MNSLICVLGSPHSLPPPLSSPPPGGGYGEGRTGPASLLTSASEFSLCSRQQVDVRVSEYMLCRAEDVDVKKHSRARKPNPSLVLAPLFICWLTLNRCFHLVGSLSTSRLKKVQSPILPAEGTTKTFYTKIKVGRWDTPLLTKDCNPTVTLVPLGGRGEGSGGHRSL